MLCLKKWRMVRHGMRNPHELKVRHYAAHVVETNENLTIFPGVTASDKIGEK